MDSSDSNNSFFYSQTYGKMLIVEMIAKIRNFLDSDPNSEYLLVIGSDSKETNKTLGQKSGVILVTAVTVHRKGTGGIYFYKKEHLNEFRGLRENLRN
ncbi:MAG: hypothetical protein COX78_00765, partial [Candidatus Levybacteria bacterium CG_4_10_14_0_2_um_filter_35_8]